MSEELRKLTIAATLGKPTPTPTESAGREGKVVAWLCEGYAESDVITDAVKELLLSVFGRERVSRFSVPLVLASDLDAVTAELEKETAHSKHLAGAVSRKIEELIATENQCGYYRMQYSRAEQLRKEACEANAKAQAKMLWQEDKLAASQQECERLREALREIAAWTDRYTAPGHPITTTARRALSSGDAK